MKHLTKPIRAINFMVLAFLMTIGSQVSAQAICETVRGRIAIVTDQAAAKDSLLIIEQQLSSEDIMERLKAENAFLDYERRYGSGSINALMTNNYEEWLAEQDCGTVDELRPRGAGFDKQTLIDLCLRHFPEVTIGKDDTHIVRISQSNIFLLYDYKGRCRSYRYD